MCRPVCNYTACNYFSSLQGLPSALLAPTSFLTDADDRTAMENSALLASLSASPHPVNPLLPTALPCDLTKSQHVSFEADSFGVPESAVESAAIVGGRARDSSGVYNPFDSDGERISYIIYRKFIYIFFVFLR